MTSIFDRIRAEREDKLAALYLDLRVPRYEQEFYVRYKPLTAKSLGKLSDDMASNMKTMIRSLAASCVKVFYVQDGQECGFDADDPTATTRFDSTLAKALGLTERLGAAEVPLSDPAKIISKLFFTEFDIAKHFNRLTEWSGINNEAVDEELLGE